MAFWCVGKDQALLEAAAKQPENQGLQIRAMVQILPLSITKGCLEFETFNYNIREVLELIYTDLEINPYNPTQTELILDKTILPADIHQTAAPKLRRNLFT